MKKYLRDYPEIFAELHPTKNDVNLSGKLTRASGRKVWWLCEKAGHEYEARVDHRTLSGSGCPYCAGRYATKENNLATVYPKIAASICQINSPEANPSKITPKSNQKLWWRCTKDDRHVWQTKVSSRIRYPDSCPICSGQQVDETNALLTLYPKLCDEWDYAKNAPLTPDRITSGTRRKVWWLCEKGHSYHSSIVGRTRRQRGCPQCSNQSSKPEIRILTEMMFIFGDVKSRYRIDKLEVDIFIPEINVAIEFDGSYFHADKQKSDAKKGKMLQKRGIHLVRVRPKPLKKISEVDLIVEKESL